MKLTTFHHDGSKWSSGELPGLDSERTLVIAFGAPQMVDDPGVLEQLVAAYPRSSVVGCSTAGEIFGTKIFDGTLVVAVAKFEDTALRTAQASVSDASASHAAGVAVAGALAAPDLRALLVLSDGLNVNGSELVLGINSVVPDTVVVTGGLAADAARFQRTWVLAEGRPTSGRVCAVGMYGDRLRVGHGSKGGWDIFGIERVVTRSRGNVLYELDGRPALDLYKEYLGDRAAGLPATALLFPLALRNADNPQTRVVRTILSVDEEARSMTFAGDVAEGCMAQLMRANFDRLIEGATEAAGMIGPSPVPGADTLAIAISCVGRRLVLGERTEEEIEATLEALPPGSRQVGFYSYGEISPHASGRCDLHNQTMTLTTISEA